MVDNELHTCCSWCDTPDIKVFTEKEDDFMTGDILIHQSITCTHEKICYKIREEQGGNNGKSK